jgi:pyrroline-5-carboxylate reductase
MDTHNIAILGGGNLGIAIAEGLLSNGLFKAENLFITRRNTKSLQPLKEKGLQVSSDNIAVVKQCRWIMLCVQPGQLEDLVNEIRPYLNPEAHVLISVITGVTIERITKMLGGSFPVVRSMPNTAIAIRKSMTCLAFNEQAASQKENVMEMFNCMGSTLVIEEELMPAATVLCASGIAFFMRFIRAATQGGIQLGFDAEDALKIAVQVGEGAAGLLATNESHPEQEIDKVTTPRGCTIAGLNEMEHQGFSPSYIKGLVTSYERILTMMNTKK